MTNLVCPTCHAEYPWQVPRYQCRYCRTEFLRGTCYVCREYKEAIRHGKCASCSNKIKVKSQKIQIADADKEYAELQARMNALKGQPIKFLTEEEWIENCRYFGGCAFCASHDIQARMLFIPTSIGGSYTLFNVLPACDKCATHHKHNTAGQSNPFKYLYSNYTRDNKDRLDKVKTFIYERLTEYERR